ncbi:MAG: FlhC family transcriptional regulator [Alphaproteobacteria bacterium]|nr:FlhC family transcriptional regulator [Alphaproteobacteria bacterium]
MPETLLAASRDPIVRSIRTQHRAIELLALGLRPKQVAKMTGLSSRRINSFRRAFVSDQDRRARPGASPATILREPQPRAAAAMFFAVYQRIAPQDATDEALPHLAPAYELYQRLMTGFEPVWPSLAIADAYTLLTAAQANQISLVICEHHETRFLAIPGSERKWGCPFCTLAKGEWQLETCAPDRPSAGTETIIGIRLGATDASGAPRLSA